MYGWWFVCTYVCVLGDTGFFRLQGINTQYMTNSTLVSPVKMEYGWNFSIFGLKMMIKSPNSVIEITWWVVMVSAWRNFKNIFPSPLFITIFRPEMLKFHPYSILTRDTRVEFVIYDVLSNVVQRRIMLLKKWWRGRREGEKWREKLVSFMDEPK